MINQVDLEIRNRSNDAALPEAAEDQSLSIGTSQAPLSNPLDLYVTAAIAAVPASSSTSLSTGSVAETGLRSVRTIFRLAQVVRPMCTGDS